jgi:hypothetical protein
MTATFRVNLLIDNLNNLNIWKNSVIISVINHASAEISDDELQMVIRCINRQLKEDFEPYWGFGGQLRLEGRSGKEPASDNPVDLRGDGIIYIWDTLEPREAVGEHNKYYSGIPNGYVFTEIARKLNENWSVTLSHEALELIADPQLNLFAKGPHPHPMEKRREVFHCFEVCDAVQAEQYPIDGVDVSNFVLPLYFTYDADRNADEPGSRNDYLGTKNKQTGKTLASFSVNPGGNSVVWDPDQRIWYTYTPDSHSENRMEIKGLAEETRRAMRYKKGLKLSSV